MSTTQLMTTLYQLQQLDLEADRLLAEHNALTTALQNNATVRKVRAELDIAQQQYASGIQAQQEAEYALHELEQRLRKNEERLYGGTVTNSREVQALQQEVQSLRAQQARQEDKVLELMDATEALQEAMEHKNHALQVTKSTWNSANLTGLERRQQIETRQGELSQQRALFTNILDAELLKRYETMRRTKQGRAVSRVEQNSCQWCRVILTPSELQRVRLNTELQTCSNCGRLLYYDR